MRASFIIFGLLTSAIAAPAAVPVDVPSENCHVRISMKDKIGIFEGVERRQMRCDVEFCTGLYRGCVKTCDSLSNGDWYVTSANFENSSTDAGISFNAQSSPSCEGCRVELEGC